MGDSAPRRVIVATRNAGKIAEISSSLDLPGWEFVTAETIGLSAPEVIEDGMTFADNAVVKAAAYHESLGMPALADDSGLAVDALDGAPGVRSARYAGDDATDAKNNAKLLAALSEVPSDARTARFVCVVAFMDEHGTPTLASGSCEGRIGVEARGSGGFGYDPLFLPDDAPGRTMAELSIEEKGRISHRGRALAALREVLLDADRPAPPRE